MEFDKSRVFSAVNADELKIGSDCFFADTIFHLRKEVTDGFISSTLERIESDDFTARFVDDGGYRYIYAYLIEPPSKPKYRSFESVDKAMEAIKAHGGWVKDKTTDDLKLITSIGKISDSVGSIGVGGSYYTFTTFLDRYVFADDGSPCGELMEE